jgi:hypothetical protein
MRHRLVWLGAIVVAVLATPALPGRADLEVFDGTVLLPVIDGREWHWSDGGVTTCELLDEYRFKLVESDSYWSQDDTLVFRWTHDGEIILLDGDDETIGVPLLARDMARGVRFGRDFIVDQPDWQTRLRLRVRHAGTTTIDTPDGEAVAHRIVIRERYRERGVYTICKTPSSQIGRGLGRWLWGREKTVLWLVEGVGPVRWKHAFRGKHLGRERFDRTLVEVR